MTMKMNRTVTSVRRPTVDFEKRELRNVGMENSQVVWVDWYIYLPEMNDKVNQGNTSASMVESSNQGVSHREHTIYK